MTRSTKPWEAKWKIVSELGGGAQGSTRLVESVSQVPKKAVLKILKNVRDQQARARMHREVTSLATLANTGVKVPQVYDGNTELYQDAVIPLYFVMEFIPGKTLADEVLTRGKIPPETALAMTMDLCRTIGSAHSENVFHRDIKPDNIIIRDFEKGDLVIVDFGLSFNQEQFADGQAVTETGDRFRNQFLSLPEHGTLGGSRRDPRSDLCSLCAILYFCLTGHQPVYLQDEQGRLPHRRNNFSIRETLGNHPICKPLEAVLDRGLAVNIDDRFQTIDELLGRLKGAAAMKDKTIENPLAVAREVRASLRQRDRKTQLADFAAIAAPLFQLMTQHAHQVGRQLSEEGFLFGISGIPATTPEGIEAVQGQLAFSLGLQAHQGIGRTVLLTMGAKGNQMVLLRRIGRNTQELTDSAPITALMGRGYSMAKARQIAEKTNPWHELSWFEPNYAPSEEDLKTHVDSSFSIAIRDLEAEILGGHS